MSLRLVGLIVCLSAISKKGNVFNMLNLSYAQLIGLVGRLQAISSEKTLINQCLSAYRPYRYYVGGCRADKPDPLTYRREPDLNKNMITQMGGPRSMVWV